MVFDFFKKTKNEKIEISTKLDKLYKSIQEDKTYNDKENRKYLFLRIKDKSPSKNCTIDNLEKFIKRVEERTETIGYELSIGLIVNKEESKIIVKIDNETNIEINYINELNNNLFEQMLNEIESLIKKEYKKDVKIIKIEKEKNNKIEELKNNDYIALEIFNKSKVIRVFSTGDNQFDENGKYKNNDFKLNKEEIECLNWFIENIKIENYKKEILDFCNEQYSMWSDIRITENDIENEINIYAIAINIKETYISKSGFIYPEISFYGDCKCDEEHGICIGFRNKKFLGINHQDWTL